MPFDRCPTNRTRAARPCAIGIALQLLLAAAPAARAEDCAYLQRLQFPDGSTACIAEFPIGRVTPAGMPLPVEASMPRSQAYSIAAILPSAQCPPIVGMAINLWPYAQGKSYDYNRTTEQRSAIAMGDCQKALAASAPAAACVCEIVIEDGKSKIPRAELLRYGVPAR